MQKYLFIACEFDGHNGPLLSMGVVPDYGYTYHIQTSETASDSWVKENVEPFMLEHKANVEYMHINPNNIGEILRQILGNCRHPVIVSDSPVDITYFCRALTTNNDGSWCSTDYETITFEVHNVDCYPTELEGAVQHNSWWDAMALRAKMLKEWE